MCKAVGLFVSFIEPYLGMSTNVGLFVSFIGPYLGMSTNVGLFVSFIGPYLGMSTNVGLFVSFIGPYLGMCTQVVLCILYFQSHPWLGLGWGGLRLIDYAIHTLLTLLQCRHVSKISCGARWSAIRASSRFLRPHPFLLTPPPFLLIA